ncbi:MAG: DUF4136 domain-containing protein [Campylobacterales bacterium]|nr:DUF4136 domain-containing protein [Campylobacterales bacterium]
MLRLLIIAVFAIFFTACSQLDIKIDYDTEYEFSKEIKYTVVHSSRVGDDTLTNDRIKKALQNTLDLKGYTMVEQKDADVLFVFHADVKDKTDIQTDYQMVGFGGYGFARGFGGGMVATTSAYNYTEGTLVVDALNPDTQKILWRGIATDELSKKDATPEEKSAYINVVVSKLINNFPREAK